MLQNPPTTVLKHVPHALFSAPDNAAAYPAGATLVTPHLIVLQAPAPKI